VKQPRSCARTRRVQPGADVKSDVTHSRRLLVVAEALPADVVKLDAILASPRTAHRLERTGRLTTTAPAFKRRRDELPEVAIHSI